MYGIEYGVKRGFNEAIGGFILSVFITVFSRMPFFEEYKLAFDLINIASLIVLLSNMSHWSYGYLLGWLISIIILIQTGLMDAWEVLLYILVPIVVIIIRLKNNFEHTAI